MGGFHLLDLVVILVIGLLVAGPKALQSMSRNAGKGVGQDGPLRHMTSRRPCRRYADQEACCRRQRQHQHAEGVVAS